MEDHESLLVLFILYLQIEPFAELSDVPVSKTGQLLYILSAPEAQTLSFRIAYSVGDVFFSACRSGVRN